VQIVIIVSF